MIVRKEVRRLEHPTEPGQWVELRLPISVGDAEGSKAKTELGLALDVVTACIHAWSYEEPVTRENVALLDAATYGWLKQAIDEASVPMTASEGEAFGSSSRPTTGPGVEPSPTSLGI